MWVGRFYRAFPNIYRDHPQLRYALLTLTVRNCPVLEVRETIQEMNAAWQRLTQRKSWPAVGFIRSLEITRSRDGKAHPHFHVLLTLEPSYFGRKYLSTAKWAEMWREALRVDYTPICDVRMVKPKPWEELRRKSPLGEAEVRMDEIRTEVVHQADKFDPLWDTLEPKRTEVIMSAIKEVIKYAVKPSDMVADPNWLLTLASELKNSRAVALGGVLRKYIEETKEITPEEEAELEGADIHFGWREQLERYQRKS